MSFPRTTRTLARSSVSAVAKFAPSSSAPRSCPRCFRAFSSAALYRQSWKRQLQTASAYHPSTLHPDLPPRNFGVPDTSIAGGKPNLNDSAPARTAQEQQNAAATQERPSVSIPEGEAQKSQPASTKPLRPRKYNFGKRKAVIKLSDSAVSHLRELLEQPEPKLIRIGTKAKGCSGLAYHLEYVDKPSPLDEQVEQDGVKVLIDNKALLNIIGSEMDWLEDKLNERFVFRNPNITEQCGCGESFSVG
ncbi:iron-sulfur cluster assembly accessory protein-like protein Isa1 [Bimuria novae-zelandiae CBS 107.79]|uniref:Iron-sulfur assembly protein 1 n=1 Tax=Bimuria novae-zelandiae CBS 107.79 TaxID=1447943 RepID=A0A6A5VQV9_9PLEO|nr:iron-sulfur cluster assembly accessory protein-like protein Isa1 [Bimuria novae-zelandiae CBS 107.79]